MIDVREPERHTIAVPTLGQKVYFALRKDECTLLSQVGSHSVASSELRGHLKLLGLDVQSAYIVGHAQYFPHSSSLPERLYDILRVDIGPNSRRGVRFVDFEHFPKLSPFHSEIAQGVIELEDGLSLLVQVEDYSKTTSVRRKAVNSGTGFEVFNRDRSAAAPEKP
ncbi:MAG: hypothetical protein ABIA93_03810 [Candidatus Woesearchaeota archaeon]